MNLRFLRTFVAIADNDGFARAAARLNLTQSAASRQIQALEDELGLRLFARIGRNVRLTAEGEDLLTRSRRLLFDAEALGQRATALKTGEVGVLRVMAGSGRCGLGAQVFGVWFGYAVAFMVCSKVGFPLPGHHAKCRESRQQGRCVTAGHRLGQVRRGPRRPVRGRLFPGCC